jgi:hypothetical protein
VKTRIRHDTAPFPLGCRWCGVEARDHGQRWVPSKKWHAWEQPTGAQIAARLGLRLGRDEAARSGQ